MDNLEKINKKLVDLQREVASLNKEALTWEEREGREYRRKYNKEKYDIVKAHLPKGTKEILIEQFKKDGFESMAAGLNYLIGGYLEEKRED